MSDDFLPHFDVICAIIMESVYEKDRWAEPIEFEILYL